MLCEECYQVKYSKVFTIVVIEQAECAPELCGSTAEMLPQLRPEMGRGGEGGAEEYN
jgi:hypothetical protein